MSKNILKKIEAHYLENRKRIIDLIGISNIENPNINGELRALDYSYEQEKKRVILFMQEEEEERLEALDRSNKKNGFFLKKKRTIVVY